MLQGVVPRTVGPQQLGQHAAVMGAFRFDGQIGEQRPDFVGFQARDRFLVQRYAKGTQ
jgi:hypothetical protein